MTRAFHQKTVLITGGTSGIGRATALELARHGADVTIVGRNQEQGVKVLAEMQHYHGKGAFMRANLAVMREVRRVAQEFHNQHSTLNALVLSAGVLNFRRIITEG
jgi:NAD(P)-dependent dehydrogenase (short-subunit alcohol dehydrogenase family)